ncbi:MAG: hypothetical protein ACOYON_01810 [Fimbriimonas sp.]
MVFAIAGFAVFQFTFGGPAGSLEANLKEARAMGLATEGNDLMEGVDRTKSLNKAYADLKTATQRDKGASRLSNKDLTDKERAEIVAKLAPAIEKAEAIAKSPKANITKDWSGSAINVLFPEFATMKMGTRLLVAKALVQSKQGDGPAAMATLGRAIVFSHHAGESPTLIGLLVSIACEAIVLNGMEKVLADHGRDAKTLAAARETLRSLGPVPDLRKAMRGELVLGLSTTSPGFTAQDLGFSVEDPSTTGLTFAMKSGVVRNAFAADIVRFQIEMHKKFPKDPSDWEGFDKVFRDADLKMQTDRKVTSTLTKIVSPYFGELAPAIGGLITRRKLMSASLNLLERRQKGAALPNALSATGPDEIDPFSSDIFQYERKGSGFRIWSIGRNRLDDGGDSSQAHDIVYVFP